MARSIELDPTSSRNWSKEFTTLVILMQDLLQNDVAPKLRELVHRAEKRDTISVEEFREALRACKLGAVDDAVWRPKLSPQGAMAPGLLIDVLIELLGGGSGNRISKSHVISESGFMLAVTEAATADYNERADRLRRLWQRRLQEKGGSESVEGALDYTDFKHVMLAADLPEVVLSTLFADAVEASRACTQGAEGHVPVLGSLKEAAGGLFGGEVVTFKLLLHACMRHQLFLRGPRENAKSVAQPFALPVQKLNETLGSSRSSARQGRGTRNRSMR